MFHIKKDIAWAKRKILRRHNIVSHWESEEVIKMVFSILDEIEEEKPIKTKGILIEKQGLDGIVGEALTEQHKSYLEKENYVVFKKTEVPKWFDDWCQEKVYGDVFQEGGHFTRNDVRVLVEVANKDNLHGLTEEQAEEINKHFFVYLKAYYGYTIESEPMFYVILPSGEYLVKDNASRKHWFSYHPEKIKNVKYAFTEKEIEETSPKYLVFKEKMND